VGETRGGAPTRQGRGSSYSIGRAVELDPSPHGLKDGVGLLMDLLLHEVVEPALHDMGHLHLQRLQHRRGGRRWVVQGVVVLLVAPLRKVVHLVVIDHKVPACMSSCFGTSIAARPLERLLIWHCIPPRV